MLLETCVSFGDELTENLTSEAAEYLQSGVRRNRVPSNASMGLQQAQIAFPYVFVPRTQPNHEQFPIRWKNAEPESMLSRAIFIASRTTLDNPLLAEALLQYQIRHS